jgi:hypothetical protein
MNNNAFSPLPDGQRPQILFRVEHSDNSSFRNHDMVSRDPSIPPTPVVFDKHLSWNPNSNTPFLSFFNSWAKALSRRKWLLGQGARDVRIIAVWAEDIQHLYRAEGIATALGYNNSGQDRRRRLMNHRYEYLVWGGIAADDYRILVVFPGDGPERSVSLLSLTNSVEASLPGDFVSSTARPDVSAELLIEIWSCTGVKDKYKHNVLVAYMGGMLP